MLGLLVCAFHAGGLLIGLITKACSVCACWMPERQGVCPEAAQKLGVVSMDAHPELLPSPIGGANLWADSTATLAEA